MGSFDNFLTLLAQVPDPRRAEGKLYRLSYVLLFSILAIVTGANSYRGVRTFMEAHLDKLNEAFGLNWKRAPAYTAIRYILKRLDPNAVEQVFRQHAAGLDAQKKDAGRRTVAIDGKTLKHSFDNFHDRKAAQILNAFVVETQLVLAHMEIEDKSNEIPAAQKLLAELGLAHHIITLDALHCQKNI
jgi:DDE_Tnp_1-associated